MNNRKNLFFNILTFVVTLALILVVIVVGGKRYVANTGKAIAFYLLGTIISGFFITLFHELGHLIAGKRNNFKFVSISFWFFKFYKENNKLKFKFILPLEEAGATEMIPISQENLDKRYFNMTKGALIMSFIVVLFGIPSLFIIKLPFIVFSILCMFLPFGMYSFLGNFLPTSTNGVRNDGGVLLGIKKLDDDSKIMLSLLSIQADLFNGKTPKEIEKEKYFDLPVVAEDDVNFSILLLSKYSYYLDNNDYKKAKEVLERLIELEQYQPKSIQTAVQIEAVYAYSTFALDSNKADENVYNIEKFINKDKNISTIRSKIAYIKLCEEDEKIIEQFKKKALKICDNYYISGVGKYEKKLIEKIFE